MKSSDPDLFRQAVTRRQLLQALMAVPAGAVLLVGCGTEGDSSTSPASVADAMATGGSTDPSTTDVSSATADPIAGAAETTTAGVETASSLGAATESTAGSATVAWASGGTELISVAYPDDSVFAQANTCTLSLTQATTEGPCYFQTDTGEDITLGKTGLPMQLCLQLTDMDCQPLAGYTIEVWSCDTRGIYSGDTSASADADRFAGDFCTAGDAEAESATYLRGQLTTDANGRVNFATIFPGWYAGRTIHIHFAVSDPDGTTRVISQYCFPDELAAEICTTHDQYADRGEQDTPIGGGTDTVFPSDGYEAYLLTTRQNPDGTLLGVGVIQIDPTAVAQDASGAGPGGAGADAPPGDGAPPGGPPPSDA